MATFIGVNPGGKSSFAVAALHYNGRFPALLIHARARSGADEVLKDIVGVTGEWGELAAIAIDAPLSWSGRAGGVRSAERMMQRLAPAWAPKPWFRPPNALPGAISVQGPALTWALSREIKSGQLPKHRVLETHARFALSRIAGDLVEDVLAYRNRKLAVRQRHHHVQRLLHRLFDTGMVKPEGPTPRTADELDALIAAVVALAYGVPDSGLALSILPPGDLRPVGKRPIALLQALP